MFILSARSRPTACHSEVLYRLLQKTGQREATTAVGGGQGAGRQPLLLDAGLPRDPGGLRVRWRSASAADTGQGLHSLPPTPTPESNSDHLEQDFFFFFERKKERVTDPAAQA